MGLYIYQTAHSRNRKITNAFAAGSGGQIVPPAPLRPGDVAMYGLLRGLAPTYWQARREKRTIYYLDNGYLKRAFKNPFDGHFRVTRNALQHDGGGNAGPERWCKLGLEIKPWRQSGEYILLCPPNETHCRIWNIDGAVWMADTMARLKAATDRPIVTRIRKDQIAVPAGFAKALEKAWCVVTHSSNGAVEAIINGVPIFATAACAAYLMGTDELERIEDPVMPSDAERQRWANVLANNQWTLQEMREGLAWKMLNAPA